VDAFSLAFPLGKNDALSLYMHHMDAIKRFLYYFLTKVDKQLRVPEKQRFHLPNLEVCEQNPPGELQDVDSSTNYKNPMDRICFAKPDSSADSFDNFITSTSFDRVFINTHGSEVLLSPQETLCLISTLKGMSAKVIAQDLNISPRTAEGYLDMIKAKTECQSRSEMYEKALLSPSVLFALQ